MKASPETIARVKAAVGPFDTEQRRQAYREGKFPRAALVKNLDTRYRWDTLYCAFRQDRDLLKSLYEEGLADAHIETVLRRVIPPLG